jgi:FkbM family methyltransferase
MITSTAADRVRALPWPQSVRRIVRSARAARRERELDRVRETLAGPKILRAFADVYPEAFFVEIGANDAEQHDHLRPFLSAGRWRGIMVEPVPYVFERLRANTAGLRGVVLENAAIADRDGELPFYHLAEVNDRQREGLPRWYDGIGSFSREAVLNHASLVPGLEQRLVCVQVPSLTFESLCRKHEVDRVDLLLVDTEGYDHEILGNFDWTVYRPRLVVYEHYHLAPEDRATMRVRLEHLGYELKEEGFDTWCLHVGPQDQLTETFRALAPGIPAASVHEDR